MGLDETGRIGRIIVNPTNPDIVYVCALGRDRARSRSAAFIAPPTAGSTGIASSSSTKTRAAPA